MALEFEPETKSNWPSTSEPDHLPLVLGRYRVTGRLGKGGFGDVFAAYDDELRRPVAIKVPRRTIDAGSGEDACAVEAQILARLDHPNIVPVFDVERTDDGRVLIVSKFIEGTNLRDNSSKRR